MKIRTHLKDIKNYMIEIFVIYIRIIVSKYPSYTSNNKILLPSSVSKESLKTQDSGTIDTWNLSKSSPPSTL